MANHSALGHSLARPSGLRVQLLVCALAYGLAWLWLLVDMEFAASLVAVVMSPAAATWLAEVYMRKRSRRHVSAGVWAARLRAATWALVAGALWVIVAYGAPEFHYRAPEESPWILLCAFVAIAAICSARVPTFVGVVLWMLPVSVVIVRNRMETFLVSLATSVGLPLVLAGAFLATHHATKLVRAGKLIDQLDALDAEFALYLRPFSSDDVLVQRPPQVSSDALMGSMLLSGAAMLGGAPVGVARLIAHGVRAYSLRGQEQREAATLGDLIGQGLSGLLPVFALGQDAAGDGIVTMAVSDAEWQARVKRLCARARVIVLHLNDSDGLRWEMTMLRAANAWDRVFLVTEPDWEGQPQRAAAWWLVRDSMLETGWRFPETCPVPGSVFALNSDWSLRLVAREAYRPNDYALAIAARLGI